MLFRCESAGNGSGKTGRRRRCASLYSISFLQRICSGHVSPDDVVKDCLYKTGDAPEIIEYRHRQCEGEERARRFKDVGLHFFFLLQRLRGSLLLHHGRMQGCRDVLRRVRPPPLRGAGREQDPAGGGGEGRGRGRYGEVHFETIGKRRQIVLPSFFPDGYEIGLAVDERKPVRWRGRGRKVHDTPPRRDCLEAAAAARRLEGVLDSLPSSCPSTGDRSLSEAAIADRLKDVLQIGRDVADAVTNVGRQIADSDQEIRRAFVALRRNLTGEARTADTRARGRSAVLESGLEDVLEQVRNKVDLLRAPSPASYRSDDKQQEEEEKEEDKKEEEEEGDEQEEEEGGGDAEGNQGLPFLSCHTRPLISHLSRQAELRSRCPVRNTPGRPRSS